MSETPGAVDPTDAQRPADTTDALVGTTGSLAGRTVGVTADRRADEQIALFVKRGADVVHGPTMATVDLTADPALRAATDAIVARPPEWLVVTTGAGVRQWFEAMATIGVDVPAALAAAGTRVIARGAKGASAVRHAGLDVVWRAPSESMPEVVEYLARSIHGAPSRSVALQLFDPDDHPATVALRAVVGEADLIEVPVYRWRLPKHLEPARVLVDAIVHHRVDAVTFTSQPAVRFLVAIADGVSASCAREVVAAFGPGRDDVLPVCVGPVCAEACVELGIEGAVWPDPPRLAPMVRLAEQRLSATDHF